MRIGLIGAGMMAGALGGRWAEAGHEVFVGARDPERARELADRIGARWGTLREAAEFGDVVLLAVKQAGFEDALVSAGASEGALAGKTIIDCGNSLDLSDYSRVSYDGRSMAEQIARVAPGAFVIKAFNLGHADVWRRARRYAGRPLAVPFAGHEEGKSAARRLIEDVGCTPLDAGELSQSHHLEAAAVLVIRRLFDGAEPLSTFAFTAADAEVPAAPHTSGR